MYKKLKTYIKTLLDDNIQRDADIFGEKVEMLLR